MNEDKVVASELEPFQLMPPDDSFTPTPTVDRRPLKIIFVPEGEGFNADQLREQITLPLELLISETSLATPLLKLLDALEVPYETDLQDSPRREQWFSVMTPDVGLDSEAPSREPKSRIPFNQTK